MEVSVWPRSTDSDFNIPFPTAAARLPIARHLGKALCIHPDGYFPHFFDPQHGLLNALTTRDDMTMQERRHSVGVNMIDKNDVTLIESGHSLVCFPSCLLPVAFFTSSQ